MILVGNHDNWSGDCCSPTVSKPVVWLIFALTVLLRLHTRWFDISGAFLAEKPSRDIYVMWKGRVKRLMKSLYGLGDAPKLFNEGLVSHLKSGGYCQSAFEPCLFYKWESHLSFIYIIFHVDDFNVAGTSQQKLDDFGLFLSIKYEITSNKNGMFLGILRTTLQDNSVLHTKPFIMQKLFDKYMPDGPFMPIPTTPMSNDYIKTIGEHSQPYDVTKFLSLIGLLIQLLEVRPDIAFHLSKISQQQKCPTKRDYDALIYMVHYLWGKRNWGIILQPSRSNEAQIMVKLRGYADAAYAIHCEHAGSGKSQYTECFDLVEDDDENLETGTGMFYFKSKLPPTVDLCSAEAEMGSTVETTKTAMLFHGILKELHQAGLQPIEIYNDNKPNPTSYCRHDTQDPRNV